MGVKKRGRAREEFVKLALPRHSSGLSQIFQAKGVDRDPTQNTNDVNLGELEEDSTIQPRFWKCYQEEAKLQDSEFVSSRDKNLDTMLVFAGLYSAILTAFLIDSTALLQQNPTDITNTFLFNIAQSQSRIETGNANSSMSPVQLPPFETPITARAVNCLWYMALMLSLASAMLAMLAKEWLAAFVTYDTCAPRTFALERQGRLNALRASSAITLIDWIPMLLHISLLLFTLGLIIQMWSIDSVVAISIISMSLFAAMFYLWTVIIGAVFNFCPYQARLSAYVRRAYKPLSSAYNWILWLTSRSWRRIGSPISELKAYNWLRSFRRLMAYDWLKRSIRKPYSRLKKCIHKTYVFWKSIGNVISRRISNAFNAAETREWDAIEWLLDHAKDQQNVNIAYQWITGLGASRFDIQKITGVENLDEGSMTSDNLLSIVRIGQKAADRLGSLCDNQYYDLIDCKGANAARYALLLSEAYKYAQHYLSTTGQSSIFITIDDYEATLMVQGFVDCSLPTLDDFWKGELPPITPNSNTLLVVAELEITVCALAALDHNNDFPLGISIIPPSSNEDRIELHNRANRGFCRGGLLLYYSLHHQFDITPTHLTTLLSRLYKLAIRMKKSKFRPNLSHQSKILAEVKMGTTTIKKHTCNKDPFTSSKPDGLLFGLVSLLEADTTASPLPEDTKYYTAALLSQIVLRLAEEWTRIGYSSTQDEVLPTWQNIGSYFTEKEHPRARSLDLLIIQELLELTHLAIRYIGHLELGEDADVLLGACLKTLDRQTFTLDDRKRVFECLLYNPLPLKSWIRMIDNTKNHSKQWYHSERGTSSPALLRSITLRLLANKGGLKEHKNVLSFVLHLEYDQPDLADAVSWLETILEAMCRVSGFDCSGILQQLQWYCNQSNVDLKCFTQRNGFMHLRDIGALNGCKDLAITMMKSLVLQLANSQLVNLQQAGSSGSKSTGIPQLEGISFRGFIHAVTFLLDHTISIFNEALLGPTQQEDIGDIHRLLTALMVIIKTQGEHYNYGKYSVKIAGVKTNYYTNLKNIISKIKAASEKVGDTKIRDDANSTLEAIQKEMLEPSLPKSTLQLSNATGDLTRPPVSGLGLTTMPTLTTPTLYIEEAAD